MTPFGWIMVGVVAALWLLELRNPPPWRTLDTGEADRGSPAPPTSPVSSDRTDPATWLYWSLLDRAGEAGFRTRRSRQ